MRWCFWELYFTVKETEANNFSELLAPELPKSTMWSFRISPIHQISPPSYFCLAHLQYSYPSLVNFNISPLGPLFHLKAMHDLKGSQHITAERTCLGFRRTCSFPYLIAFSWVWVSTFSFSAGVVMKFRWDNMWKANYKMLTNISQIY